MNVVGRVGSLISQGVYSVATPFHPFGGAVDVIAVQQKDGTFRSTPWYVRFGKFQGVIKGAEKIVRITVNGSEANFHMYLDNSGEAYFVREVDSGKGSDTGGGVLEDDTPYEDANDYSNDNGLNHNAGVCRLQHSVSDTGVSKLRDEFGGKRIGRSESEGNRRYYDFQDDQSSLQDSGELSTRYDNLDAEHLGESKPSDSEVILVSVDGHVLTAPITASEQSSDDVKLDTPQFHLGPGDGDEFCEGTGEITSGGGAWGGDYITNLNSSATSDASDTNNDLCHQLEVCEEADEDVGSNEGDHDMHSDSDDASGKIRKGDVFKSCLELGDLAKHVDSVDDEETGPMLEAPPTRTEVEETEDEDVDLQNSDGFSPSRGSESPGNGGFQDLSVGSRTTLRLAPVIENAGPNSVSSNSTNDSDWNSEQVGISAEKERIDVSEIVESQTATGVEGAEDHTSMRFEISLCRNELQVGMGLSAASKVFDAHRISPEDYKSSAASIIKNDNLIVKIGEKYLSWERAAPIVLGKAAFGLDLPVEPNDAIPVDQNDIVKPKEDDSGTSTPSGRRWRLWQIPFRRVKTLEHTNSTSSSEEVYVDTESVGQNLQAEPTPQSDSCHESPRKQFIRTNIPTTDQIASLDLKDGQNMITFSFSTRVLGTQQVDAHIYLWKWNARIVISDVDGTITKSDVLGQFMPLVGKDWTQSGVARLFSAIKENGYQLLFLSARAIVQAYLTRSFLVNLKQDGKALPNGPVVISPDGLFPSLYREVIRRAPHEFKIACLEDIKKLFPSDYNPFYAGFGNRDTDELSYRKIGIPKGKIFIINPKGEVAISQHRIDVKSYTSLHTLVNDMFPPTSLLEQEDYNSWNFWKVPLPLLD